MNQKLQTTLYLLLFPLLVDLIRRFFLDLPAEIKFGDYGSIDFSEYWSALSIWLAGNNPYDAEQMFLLQRNVGSSQDGPILMWNPPWLLIILRLLIFGDFETSAYMWLLTNITLCSVSVLLLAGHYKTTSATTFLMLISSAIFIPIHTSLIFGQLGPLLLLGTTLYFLGITRKNELLEGTGLFILSTKPHLLYLLILARFIHLLKRKDISRILKVLSPSVLIIGTFCIFSPSTMHEWLYALSSPATHNAAGVDDWIVASFTGFVRNLSFIVFGNSIPWMMALVPTLGVIALIVFMYKGKVSEDPEIYFPVLLTASLFFNPYGWVSDSTCLLLVPLLLVAKSRPSNTVRVTSWVVILQLAILPFAFLLADQQHWLFWYPLAVFLFWTAMKRYGKKAYEI